MPKSETSTVILRLLLCSILFNKIPGCLNNEWKPAKKHLEDSSGDHSNPQHKKGSTVGGFYFDVEITDFLELRYYNHLVVDKSLLIEEFLEEHSQVILITRPRMFSKTINLDMIRRFFELELDHRGFMFSRQNRVNYRFFCGGSVVNLYNKTRMLGPMKICLLEEAMYEQGVYPTIFISFRNVTGYDYDHFVNSLWSELFRNHYYLQEYCVMNITDGVEDIDKERIWRFFYDEEFRKANIKMSLYFLTKILYHRFRKQVWVFIDDYDTPLLYSYLDFKDNNNTQDLPKVHQLMHHLFKNAFNNNPFLRTAIITGTLVISKADTFKDFHNFRHYSVMDSRFSQFFGFNEKEVALLARRTTSKNNEKLILNFYGAYEFGGVRVYNPHSIMKCIVKQRIARYWIREENPVVLKQAFANDVKLLATGESIVSKIYDEVDIEDLDKPENVMSLLLYTGYLKVVKKVAHMTYELMPPNDEVKQMFVIAEKELAKKAKLTTKGKKT